MWVSVVCRLWWLVKKVVYTDRKLLRTPARRHTGKPIGIARAFSYGGYKGREFYNPEIPPASDMTPEQYRNSTSPTINHFYEKLLLLKDRMNTKTGKILAEERHQFMLLYLEQFYKEWN